VTISLSRRTLLHGLTKLGRATVLILASGEAESLLRDDDDDDYDTHITSPTYI